MNLFIITDKNGDAFFYEQKKPVEVRLTSLVMEEQLTSFYRQIKSEVVESQLPLKIYQIDQRRQDLEEKLFEKD